MLKSGIFGNGYCDGMRGDIFMILYIRVANVSNTYIVRINIKCISENVKVDILSNLYKWKHWWKWTTNYETHFKHVE